MKALVLYAHPNPKSFNHAVLESFTKGLKDGGHTFEVVDLYAIKFDPCLGIPDFAQFTGEQMPKDVLDQQEKVAKADALVLIYPVWFLSFPAILKGWLDRVFSLGFAYKYAESGEVVGLLKHQKALLINTAYYSEELYRVSGLGDAMKKIMVDASFKESGIPHVEQVFLYGVGAVDDETMKGYLASVYSLGKEF